MFVGQTAGRTLFFRRIRETPDMLCWIVAGLMLVVVLVLLARCDGDLLLMLAARFGKQPESLAGNVIWITGASSGIGEHLAYCLARAGARLVLSARREQVLEEVKKKCLDLGKGKISVDDILIVPFDVTAIETHGAAVQRVIDYFNKIDVLVNNAGRSQRANWVDIELSVDRELFEVNALAPVSLTQKVLPHMIQRRQGQIVVNSSIAGKCGYPHSRSYCASKFATHGFFECLRAEVSEHNIDVIMLCPGPVHSNLFIEAAKAKQGEMLGRSDNAKDRKMETDRCAYLSCVAMANKLYEAWICQHPSLFLVYLSQYCPVLGQWIMKTAGVKLLMKIREGR